MTFTWVLIEDGQIVCAFTSEPNDQEILDTANDMTGEQGKFYDKIGDTYLWIGEDTQTEFTLTKTELK
jgi:hypothetical protein